jgi:hypothetical protein
MPRIARTLIPRIKKSLRDNGLATTLLRSFLLPLHLFRDYRASKSLRHEYYVSDFDRQHGIDTGGEFEGWTYLSDLDIPSPNWIDCNDYTAIEPIRFEQVMTSLDIVFENFTFIDFGSGKGLALLLASEYPFRRIIGLEFAPALHKAAEANILRYNSATQRCSSITPLNLDFVNYTLPPEPSVLFFFRPSGVRVLSEVVEKIGQSVRSHSRPLYIAYVATTPEQEQLFASCGFLEKIFTSTRFHFSLYRSGVKENTEPGPF